jgi:hypothetical protein
MIMKMKYAAALVFSLGFLAIAASLFAQQDVFKGHMKSPDLPTVDPTQARAYSNDSYSIDAQQPRSVLFSGGHTVEWKLGEIPARDQLAVEEQALANEANEIRQRLDSATTDAQRSDVRTKLAENLGKQFDVRQKRHGLEIEALETQVKKLKELVRRRQESRTEIISHRVDQILREAEGLGW